jgi:hypothetical protein
MFTRKNVLFIYFSTYSSPFDYCIKISKAKLPCVLKKPTKLLSILQESKLRLRVKKSRRQDIFLSLQTKNPFSYFKDRYTSAFGIKSSCSDFLMSSKADNTSESFLAGLQLSLQIHPHFLPPPMLIVSHITHPHRTQRISRRSQLSFVSAVNTLSCK